MSHRRLVLNVLTVKMIGTDLEFKVKNIKNQIFCHSCQYICCIS